MIEQRRAWSLALLEFLASQPILNIHPVFTSFLFEGQISGGQPQPDSQPLGGSHSADQIYKEFAGLSVGGEVRRSCSSPELAGLEVVITPSLTIDTTPVLSPETNMENDDSDLCPGPVERDTAVSEPSNVNLVSGMSESDTKSGIPDYIRTAAEHISSALSHEAEEEMEQSLVAYRAAIGGLLTNVQSDPDPVRQAQVKRRIAQYISKAEQLGKVFWFYFFIFTTFS